MNIFEQMQKPPFNLDEGQIGWVKETFSKMDLKAKIGQLFCLAARSSEEQWVNDIFDISVCRNSRNYSRPLRPTATSPKGRGLGNIRADAGLTELCSFLSLPKAPTLGTSCVFLRKTAVRLTERAYFRFYRQAEVPESDGSGTFFIYRGSVI